MATSGGDRGETNPVPTDINGAAGTDLDDAMLADLAPFGHERAIARGDVLYRAGDDVQPFFVILEGEVEIVRRENSGDVVIATHGARRFLGELNMLTGQRPYLTARVSQPGRVLVVELDEFRRLMGTKPELSDVIFRTFVARRQMLRSGDGAAAIQIIGSRYSPEAMALRAYANRSKLVHTWIDVEQIDDVPVFLAGIGARPSDLPLVITPTGRLRRPTVGEFAERLGFTYRPVPGYVGRHRSGRPGRRGVRSLRGSGDDLARLRRRRGPSWGQFAYRELPRLPQRRLR
jgi:thioredoxin reductase (NADPH)